MSGILTRDEIANLLHELAPALPQSKPAEHSEIQPYEFGREEKIVRGRLPALDTIFERFARSARGKLTAHLGKNCLVTCRGVELVKYGLFSKRLPLPSSMHLWRMPPLRGHALLVFSPALAYGMIDCLFGGGGRKKNVQIEGREYSAIENRLLGKVATVVLEELREAWQPVHSVDIVYARSEVNPLALSLAVPSDTIATATFEVEIDHRPAEFQIAIPYSVLESIKDKLSSGHQVAREHVDSTSNRVLRAHLRTTAVKVSVELARGSVQVRDLLLLGVGDVLSLSSFADAPAIVTIEGVPKFTGVVGAHRGSKAIRITGPVKAKSA